MHRSLKNIRLLLILLLIFSVAGSSLQLFKESKANEKLSKELVSQKEKQEPRQQISQPVELEAVVPFFAFDLLKDSYLISQFDFQDDLEETFYVSEPLYTSKYFKTLFCYVISPNAP